MSTKEEIKFKYWLERVEAKIEESTGHPREDLPDMDYRSMFVEGLSPQDVVEQVLAKSSEL